MMASPGRKRLLFLGALLLLIAALLYGLPRVRRSEKRYLTVSGRVEATEIELAVRIPGRLREVLIADGAEVRRGDTVAVIEDEELRSRRRELLRGIEELADRVDAAEFNLRYTASNVRHTVEEAEKALSIAKARLRQAEAKKENAEREFRRYANLLKKGAVPPQRYDSVRLAYRLSEEDVNAAEKEVEKAEIMLKKAEAGDDLLAAKEKELLAMKKSLERLRESLKQVEINLGYTRVVAPLDGVVLRRVAEPGEVLPGGGVVGVMINPESIHVKTFVPEAYIGRLRLEMEAEVFTDAYPGQPLTGYICHISDRAEFTPKEVQSREERVKQVFGVKICFNGSTAPIAGGKTVREVLKKGMPVDVRFRVRD